jgi:hypothetical protein
MAQTPVLPGATPVGALRPFLPFGEGSLIRPLRLGPYPDFYS